MKKTWITLSALGVGSLVGICWLSLRASRSSDRTIFRLVEERNKAIRERDIERAERGHWQFVADRLEHEPTLKKNLVEIV